MQLPQFENPRGAARRASRSAPASLLILLGLFKKVAIADALAPFVNEVFAQAGPRQLADADLRRVRVRHPDLRRLLRLLRHRPGLVPAVRLRAAPQLRAAATSRGTSRSSGARGTSRCRPGCATTSTCRSAGTGRRQLARTATSVTMLSAACGTARRGRSSSGACSHGLFLVLHRVLVPARPRPRRPERWLFKRDAFFTFSTSRCSRAPDHLPQRRTSRRARHIKGILTLRAAPSTATPSFSLVGAIAVLRHRHHQRNRATSRRSCASPAGPGRALRRVRRRDRPVLRRRPRAVHLLPVLDAGPLGEPGSEPSLDRRTDTRQVGSPAGGAIRDQMDSSVVYGVVEQAEAAA